MPNKPTIHSFKKTTANAQYFIALFVAWFFVGGILLIQEHERSIYKAINEQHTSFKDMLFPYLTHVGESWVIIPVLLLLFLFKRYRTPRFALTMVACNITPFLLTQAIKGLVNAPRPLKYFAEANWIHRVANQPINYDYSFPSGHSEGAFAFLCFLSLLLPSKARWVGILLFLSGLVVMYSRIYLSQHFFRDVYVGSLIGGLSCMVCFWLINPFKQTDFTQ